MSCQTCSYSDLFCLDCFNSFQGIYCENCGENFVDKEGDCCDVCLEENYRGYSDEETFECQGCLTPVVLEGLLCGNCWEQNFPSKTNTVLMCSKCSLIVVDFEGEMCEECEDLYFLEQQEKEQPELDEELEEETQWCKCCQEPMEESENELCEDCFESKEAERVKLLEAKLLEAMKVCETAKEEMAEADRQKILSSEEPIRGGIYTFFNGIVRLESENEFNHIQAEFSAFKGKSVEFKICTQGNRKNLKDGKVLPPQEAMAKLECIEGAPEFFLPLYHNMTFTSKVSGGCFSLAFFRSEEDHLDTVGELVTRINQFVNILETIFA